MLMYHIRRSDMDDEKIRISTALPWASREQYGSGQAGLIAPTDYLTAKL
jgi:hypothetical protein